MKPITVLPIWFLFCVCITVVEALAGETTPVYPGKEWAIKRPEQVGMDIEKLKELSDYADGFGCVVRHGYMVYTWGDAGRRKDVAILWLKED